MWYHLNKLSIDGNPITQREDFPIILEQLVGSLLAIYPYLADACTSILQGLQTEMQQFATTVAKGEQLLQEYFSTP
jgi:alanyl-tRNA synthetase